jgi:hypothetical protein
MSTYYLKGVVSWVKILNAESKQFKKKDWKISISLSIRGGSVGETSQMIRGNTYTSLLKKKPLVSMIKKVEQYIKNNNLYV